MDLVVGFLYNIVLDIVLEVKVEIIIEKGKNFIVILIFYDK